MRRPGGRSKAQARLNGGLLMPNVVAKPFGLLLGLLILIGPGLNAVLTGWALAADMQEGAKSSQKLSQDAGRTCTETCIAQCRSALAACAKGSSKDPCRAEFQICARRCVVACGSR